MEQVTMSQPSGPPPIPPSPRDPQPIIPRAEAPMPTTLDAAIAEIKDLRQRLADLAQREESSIRDLERLNGLLHSPAE